MCLTQRIENIITSVSLLLVALGVFGSILKPPSVERSQRSNAFEQEIT